MRKLFWRLHSWIGLFAGLGLVLIGLTGSILVFHEEIDGTFRSSETRVIPTSTGRLPLRELIASVDHAFPQHAITGWAFNRDNPKAADGAYVMPFGTREWRYITVDPYSGRILSSPTLNSQSFKGWILDLHYTLFLGHAGMAVSGVLGVLLCFLGISGLWIYRRFWKKLFRLRWRASARMLLGDVHRFTGVTSVLFNLIIGFTGAYWNISHVIDELFHHHEDPADSAHFHQKLFSPDLDPDAMLADAHQRIEGFETHYISLPWAPQGVFTLWGKTENAGWFRSSYGSQVTYDNSMQFTSAHDLRKDPLWPQIHDAFEPLHFGDFGGLPIKIIWAFTGLSPAILCFSGMAIWWKRRRHL